MTHAIWATVSLGKGISENARPHSVEGGTSPGAACTSGAPACSSVGTAGTAVAAGRTFLVATAFQAAAFGFLVFAAFLPAALNFRFRAACFPAELRPLGMGIPLVTDGVALIALFCGAFKSSDCGGRNGSLMPLRESTPQSGPICARSVQALGRGTGPNCHSRPPAGAIRRSQRRLAGRLFVPRLVSE